MLLPDTEPAGVTFSRSLCRACDDIWELSPSLLPVLPAPSLRSWWNGQHMHTGRHTTTGSREVEAAEVVVVCWRGGSAQGGQLQLLVPLTCR